MKTILTLQVVHKNKIKETDNYFYVSVVFKNKIVADVGWIDDVFDESKFKKEIGEPCQITNIIKCKDIHEYNKLKFSK